MSEYYKPNRGQYEIMDEMTGNLVVQRLTYSSSVHDVFILITN